MCLLVLAYQALADCPLLLAGNRDEQHARASAPLQWWPDGDLLAGRDLVAGGTWLGAARNGRFAVVTNFRTLAAPPNAPSRGQLVPGFLRTSATPLEYLDGLRRQRERYAGFTLVVGDTTGVACYSNADQVVRPLSAGIFGIGNGPLNEDRRRLNDARSAVTDLLTGGRADTASLVHLFRRADGVQGETPFLSAGPYGTRCTSVLRIAGMSMSVEEVTYGPDGTVVTTSAERWTLAS